MAQSILHRSGSMAMVGSWGSEKCSNAFPMLWEEMPGAKDTGSAGGEAGGGVWDVSHKRKLPWLKNTTER